MAPAAIQAGFSADVASAYWSTEVGNAFAKAVVAVRGTGWTVGAGEGCSTVDATAGAGAAAAPSPPPDLTIPMTTATTTRTTTPTMAGISHAGRFLGSSAGGSPPVTGGTDAGTAAVAPKAGTAAVGADAGTAAVAPKAGTAPAGTDAGGVAPA